MPREFIALIISGCFALFAVYCSVKKIIDYKTTRLILIFSVIFGVVITNYDVVSKLKLGVFEVETAKQEINTAKVSALKNIHSEVEKQKESINLLISDANNTTDKIEKQKKALSDVISKAEDLRHRLAQQEHKQKDTDKKVADLQQILIAHNIDKKTTQEVFDILENPVYQKQGIDKQLSDIRQLFNDSKVDKKDAEAVLNSFANILFEADVIKVKDRVDVLKKSANEKKDR